MWKKLAILLVIGGLLGLFAFGLTRNPRAIPSPLVSRPAPDFTLTTFDGKTFRLSEQRGKIVVINFWASWCYPACYEEAPVLEATWRAFKEKDVVVVGINIQDKKEDALQFIRRFDLTFPNGPDPDGKITIDYGIYGVPETFIIGRDGTIVFKQAGAVGWETLVQALHPLFRG
jgi:cytochrome c biogenesis protein CcmG/thiol:disulfide interchange protein DsbE